MVPWWHRDVLAAGKLRTTRKVISHHLKVLHDAVLLDRDKRGVWVWYRARTGALASLATLIGAAPPTLPRRLSVECGPGHATSVRLIEAVPKAVSAMPYPVSTSAPTRAARPGMRCPP